MYCHPKLGIDLAFEFDYEKCRNYDMFLKFYLCYKNTDLASKPVLRCPNHANAELSAIPEIKVEATKENAGKYCVVEL